MSGAKRKRQPAEPNLVDDYSELCDALRDKYEMTDGDWKALLDMGMALYKKSLRAPAASHAGTSRLIEEIQAEINRHAAAFLRNATDAHVDAEVAEAESNSD